MSRAILLLVLTLFVVVISADQSYYGSSSSNQVSAFRKMIKEQARQIDELLEINQQLMIRLKACETPSPRLSSSSSSSSSSDADYSPKRGGSSQSSRSSSSSTGDKYKSEPQVPSGRDTSKDTRDYRESSSSRSSSRDYARDYSRDSRDYYSSDSRDYNTRDYGRDMSRGGSRGGAGAGGMTIDPFLAEQLFAASMMPMYRSGGGGGRPSPQPQGMFNMNGMYPQMFPSSRSPFSGPSFRPANQRKESSSSSSSSSSAKDLVPISLEPPMPEPISCNQVQELEGEKTSQDQASGQEIKIKYESSTCSCEQQQRHCRFSYSSVSQETCARQEITDETLTNCDLLTQCMDDDQCDGILHDNGKVYKVSCAGDNTVSTVLADPQQFVIQIKNCL